MVKYKSGNILFENEKVAERWKEYMAELYIGDEIEDKQMYIENEEDINMNDLGPVITREEFYNASKDLKPGLHTKLNWNNRIVTIYRCE